MSASRPGWDSEALCNVAGALAEQARRQPEAPALHWPAGRLGRRVRWASASWRELDELSDRYARGLLALGIEAGSRAALMVPPGREFCALFFALFKAGIVPVLIDPGIGIRALGQCLAEAAPRAFIGVSRAQAASVTLRWASGSIRRRVTLGPRLGWGGARLAELAAQGSGDGPVLAATRPGALAAILFTSGSTGPPKGVVYRHRHFTRQVEMLRDAFGIERGEVDLATFPPFALFDPALGMTTVVPPMDPTRPARANPRLLVDAIERFGVTNLFGSPALLRVLGHHCATREQRLPTLRRVISAGAAVPLDVVRKMQAAIGEPGGVHTPYGATECLPVASISSAELTEEVERLTRTGAGICVGPPLPPNRVGIIAVSEAPRAHLAEVDLLPAGSTGEIVVHGPTTTDAYWHREAQTRRAKLTDAAGRVWHRMGDAGYLDDRGRLWYCGRTAQRVETGAATLFPDQVEAVFNAHPGVARSALVGVGPAGRQRPVLCVEADQAIRGGAARARLRAELLALAPEVPGLGELAAVLFHGGFPVDIRHNAKIGRERLAEWAAGRL